MAQMSPADAVTAVRSATAHDNDEQTTDVQLTAELDREYRRVRRWLSSFLPELYSVTATPVTLANVQSGATIDKEDDYERIIRLEYEYPHDNWIPLSMRPMLNSSSWWQRDVSGTYRVTYVQRPVDGYTVFDVPDGCEDLILEPVKAWVRQRHDEDPSFHLGRRVQLEKELRADLSFRYGAHSRSILGGSRFWPRATFFEQGDHFVIY
jgi:hypothetical protein